MKQNLDGMEKHKLGLIFNNKDLEKITDLLKNKDFSGWFGNNTGGEYLQEFERKYAEFCRAKYAITTCSGSAAIFVSLKACGIRQNDLVAVPSYTHIGSVAPIVLAGATPYFVDVDKYGNLNPEEIKNKKFKAIVAVHQLGIPCDIKKIKEYSAGAYIIEDASHSLGSEYHGKKTGTLGDIGAFSIGGGRTKIVCAGEGGVITTNKPELAERCKNIRNHGDRYFDKDYFGFNFRMSELNALVSLLQFNKIGYLLKWQIKNGRYFIENSPAYLNILKPPQHTKPNYYFIGCEYLLNKKSKIQLFEEIRKRFGNPIPRKSISGGYSKLISETRFYSKYPKNKLTISREMIRNIVWVDWHRFPRTKEDIDKLLKVLNK